jgi:CubicO group peptidase (beta-lactamase class C family)
MKTRMRRTMMHGVLFYIFLLLALSFTALPGAAMPRASASDLGLSRDEGFAAIDRYVEQEMRAARVPGLALGIVQGDQIVHLNGFGVADPSGRPVTPQTPFIIGSTTKSMTAVAIMQLVEAGKLELDAPIQRYLPWFHVADPDASAHITLRHLLNHTSGLPTTTGEEFVNSADMSDGAGALEQRVRALSTAELTAPVGTIWQYCNANYDVLGLIVQTVAGQSYETYLQEHLFTPLAMRQTFTAQVDAQQHGMATGYRYWFGVPWPADLPYNRGDLPAGFVISTAEDMAHYLIAHLNAGRYQDAAVLSPTGIAELHRPAVLIPGESDIFYGLGWYIMPTNGVPTVRHVGATANFHANLVLVPESGWGVVLLMNSNSAFLGRARIDGIAVGVTSLLVGRAPPVAASFYDAIMFYFIILGVAALQVVGIIRSMGKLRRWRTQPARRPHGWRALVWHIGLPVVLNLIPAVVFLVGAPQLFGPLSGLIYVAPDLGYIMVVSGVVGLGWSVLRTGLAFFVLRTRGAPIAVGAATSNRRSRDTEVE